MQTTVVSSSLLIIATIVLQTSPPYISEFREPFVEQWVEQRQRLDGIATRHPAVPFIRNPLAGLGKDLASVLHYWLVATSSKQGCSCRNAD